MTSNVMILLIVLGSLSAIAIWEFCWPRRRREFPAIRRGTGNIGLWLLNLFLAASLFPTQSTIRPHLEELLGIGLPAWPITDFGVNLAAGFLLLDLFHYAVHRCEHAVRLFWRFHALHHSDPDLDVTTAVRQHPISYVVRGAVYWAAIVVLDIPATVALAYSLALFTTTAMAHGTIRLPERVELWLQLVLITTDMHRIHHSVLPRYANSNYGNLFSIWDRVFGTYAGATREEHERLIFGVSELRPVDGVKISAMFLTPWLFTETKAR